MRKRYWIKSGIAILVVVLFSILWGETKVEYALAALILLIAIGLIIYPFLKPEWKLPLSNTTINIGGVWAIVMSFITLALARDSLNLYQSIDLYTTTTLVAVTAKYATLTHAMAKYMEIQAEEMKKQRLAARPFVIPDIDLHAPEKSYSENMKDLAQGLFPLKITNVGTASAIELELMLRTATLSVSTELPLLLPSANWRAQFQYTCPPLEGNYELKVSFRAINAKPDSPPLEVILPFELKLVGTEWWIQRHKLIQKLIEV